MSAELTKLQVREEQRALGQLPEEGRKKFHERKEKAEKELAQHSVEQWKFQRALFEQYGGRVLFYQADPFFPVDAYEKFLRDMERAKVFEIFDEETRRSFYQPFTRDTNKYEWQPDEVNYDKPWWLQEPKSPWPAQGLRSESGERAEEPKD